jgi:hypothetical protein
VIDAIIGFSVAYKGLDNVGAWKRWLGMQPSIKLSTTAFGSNQILAKVQYAFRY